MGINISDFPDPFYIYGSFISFQQIELYGITSRISDYLNEFYAQDADFHINWAAQYLDICEEDDTSDDLIYRHNEIRCAAGEIFTNRTGLISESIQIWSTYLFQRQSAKKYRPINKISNCSRMRDEKDTPPPSPQPVLYGQYPVNIINNTIGSITVVVSINEDRPHIQN
ncbi:MAG: hypothetical protein EZS28_024686 [Streblomastix strix]|uniref:Uncharacterized protein n=1 Tax=Streblomastix strix TaxID=222440 RepID=A0A5J4VBG8_9EUKA|nr:MAG: hypothetical protein EZS28_024686 [Streblomastix strix]